MLKAAGAHLTSQWFADQGFAVLVVDGRGVDGRGPAWDREMYRDFTVALEDQVDALHAAAERFDFLDLGRVGMRGWSFGGELTAMALLRRPDVFLAGVVGAPVTDQHLYDTFYTERYLGKPQDEPEVYRRNSPLFDAASLSRPMLLIHGLADDNVFVANTLRFSAALFEAGKWHELVLIPNATHLTRSTAVTENILRMQLDFLRRDGARLAGGSGDGRPPGDDRVVLVLRADLGRTAGRSQPGHGVREPLGVDGRELLPLAGEVLVREDRGDGADRHAGVAVHALVRLDVEHPRALVDAVDGALVDARLVLDVDARFRDDVGHGCPFPGLRLDETIPSEDPAPAATRIDARPDSEGFEPPGSALGAESVLARARGRRRAGCGWSASRASRRSNVGRRAQSQWPMRRRPSDVSATPRLPPSSRQVSTSEPRRADERGDRPTVG